MDLSVTFDEQTVRFERHCKKHGGFFIAVGVVPAATYWLFRLILEGGRREGQVEIFFIYATAGWDRGCSAGSRFLAAAFGRSRRCTTKISARRP